ncbi:MAG: hypothetical protein ACREOU_07760 [Candidatus Eiseniibacteriota bacterium]
MNPCHTIVLAGSFLLIMPSILLGGTPRTIVVDDDALFDPGPGDPGVSDPLENGSGKHPFDAIQEAISAAISGDTVLVCHGSPYTEPPAIGFREPRRIGLLEPPVLGFREPVGIGLPEPPQDRVI